MFFVIHLDIKYQLLRVLGTITYYMYHIIKYNNDIKHCNTIFVIQWVYSWVYNKEEWKQFPAPLSDRAVRSGSQSSA